MKFKIVAALILTTLFSYWFVKHSGFIPFSHNPMQYMPNMHRTPVYKPQRASSLSDSGTSALVPPAGAVARNAFPYPHPAEMAAADVPAQANPLPRTREVVERGRKMYETHCMVCHGASGMGDGSVIGPYPKPPLLMSDKLLAYADSQIFHVITRGQNIMMPYGHKVRTQDRWAIVHYVRVLQRAYNPKPEDLELFQQKIGNKKENQ